MENNKGKFSDFWTYNKWKIIGVLLVVAFVALCFSQCNPNPGADLGILHISEKQGAKGDLLVEELKGNVHVVAENGEPVVEFRSVYIPTDSVDAMETGAMEKIQMEFASAECHLYILDGETIYMYRNSGIFTDLSDYVSQYGISDEELYVGENGEPLGICVENNALLNGLGVDTEDLYLAIRAPRKDNDVRNQNAVSAFEYIISNR